MYILQEFDFGFWQDLYSHSDYNYLLAVREVQQTKNPTKKYRIVEVMEIV